MRRLIPLLSAALAVALVGVIAAIQLSHAVRGWSRGEDSPQLHFTLTDHHGKAVTEADFHGKYLLVYFGYTFCPDVCPTSLQTIGEALDRLGPHGEEVVPLFITVDPERDTAPVLADYVAAFGPRIVGLTGTPEQIKVAADRFGAFYAKNGSGDAYAMDHSSAIYLMEPDGRLVATMRHGTAATALAKLLQERLPD